MIFKKFIVIFSIYLFNIVLNNLVFAGSFIDIDGDTKYVNDLGEIVKDTWAWVDANNDSIAECYRFDANGHILRNYESPDGHKTNENGELVEGDVVVKKMLSSGVIISHKPSPFKGITEFIGNIIAPKKIKAEKDRLTNRVDNREYYEEIPESIIPIDGVVINNTKKEMSILMNETAENGIIYSNGKASEIADGVKIDKKVVSGKEIRKFISAKNNCIEKVNNAYIFGGAIWDDVIQLNGNNASIKILLDGNNYVRFEVAHQSHGEETRDTDLVLEMYVDGEFFSSFDEFIDGDPELVEEYIDDAKTVELKVNIKSGSRGRRVYIKNGRLKKVKIKD